MNKIKCNFNNEMLIKIGKIKPFFNICKVTNLKEICNIKIEYIPNMNVVELESYRDFFLKVFNDYIETIANDTFNILKNLLEPKYLKVTIYLDDERLTPWSVSIEGGYKNE